MRLPGLMIVALPLLPIAADLPAAAATNWTTAQQIEITLSNFAFKPANLHLHAGQPYRLHFVNTGSGAHNFSAKDFFGHASYPSGVGPDGGVVELAKGASADISLIPAAGTYKAKCTHFMHSSFGMVSQIVVD